MSTTYPEKWPRIAGRGLALGLSVGVFTSALSIGGAVLGLFNCVSAWLIATVIFTLVLMAVAGPCRMLAVGSATLVAYFAVISYVVGHGVHSGRWEGDDTLVVFVSFGLLVVLPSALAVALDAVCFWFRRARKGI